MSLTKRAKKFVKKLIHSKKMLHGIGIASFLEATIIPIPLETLLVPLMQSRRDKLWVIAAVTTLGCVLGALLGYVVGYFMFDLLREYVVGSLTTQAQFESFQQAMNENGFLFIFSTGVTPVPLQVAMLAAGLSKYSLLLYLLAVTTSRIVRYFGLAVLVYYFGNKTEKVIKKYKWQVVSIICIIISGLFVLKWLGFV